jgi:hypothetical protein
VQLVRLELEIRCSIRLSYGRRCQVKWHKPKHFACLFHDLFPRRLDVTKSVKSFVIEPDPFLIPDQIRSELLELLPVVRLDHVHLVLDPLQKSSTTL